MEAEEAYTPHIDPKPLDPAETQRNMDKARQRLTGKTITVAPRAVTEKGVEYLDKMAEISQAPALSRLDFILKNVRQMVRPGGRPHVLPYEEAAIVVAEIYQLELARRGKTVVMSPADETMIENVTRYFIGDPEGPLPLNKGLFIYGPVGTGKTFLLDVMQTLAIAVPITPMQFQTVSTKDLIRFVKDAQSLRPLAKFEAGGLLLDDLGDEAGDENGYIKIFGDKDSPLDLLLSNRYIRYTRFGQLTHITSNLDIEDIEKRYGSRIYDRFGEMFEPIPYLGESKRS